MRSQAPRPAHAPPFLSLTSSAIGSGRCVQAGSACRRCKRLNTLARWCSSPPRMTAARPAHPRQSKDRVCKEKGKWVPERLGRLSAAVGEFAGRNGQHPHHRQAG